jgi:hypothetical protein
MATCPVCGNNVARGQVCWVCARTQHDQKADGGQSRHLKRRRARTHEFVHDKPPPPILAVVSPVGAPFARQKAQMKRPKPEWWRRLEGFNRLLRDAYGRDLRISAILVKHDVSQAQVDCWKSDEPWLLHLVVHLQRCLVTEMARIFSKEHAYVISYWYGLGANKALPPATIAFRLGASPARVHAMQRAFLAYLQTQHGQRLLERVILKAALGNTARFQ